MPEDERLLPCGTAFVVMTADIVGEGLLMVGLRQTNDILIQGGAPAEAPALLEAVVPQPKAVAREGGIYARTTRGVRIYLKTPRLRGLLALNLAAAAAGAMVIVNTVVYVRTLLGRSADDMALALAAFGGGSMVAALLLETADQVVVVGLCTQSGVAERRRWARTGVGGRWRGSIECGAAQLRG